MWNGCISHRIVIICQTYLACPTSHWNGWRLLNEYLTGPVQRPPGQGTTRTVCWVIMTVEMGGGALNALMANRSIC
jgi:hypothetical protein